MPYAVVQTELSELTPDILKPAFRAVSGLTEFDAVNLSEKAFGIIAENLSREDATVISNALLSQGVQTEIVDQQTLVALPPAKGLRNLQCMEEGMVITESLSLPTTLEWSHVVLVAAGRVPVRETRGQKKEEVSFRARDMRRVSSTVTSYNTESTHCLLLEIFVDVAPARYQIRCDKFNYAYLGDRMIEGDHDANYLEVAQDVLRFAPHAPLNLGAGVIRDDPTCMFEYATEQAFERELTWRFWHDFRR
jgi:hypothetical protein